MKKGRIAFSGLLVLGSLVALPVGQTLAADAEGSPGNSNGKFTITSATDPTNPDNGKLILKSVPGFDFGTIQASKIYSGFTGRQATADGTLKIADNRVGTNNWKLDVKLAKFSKNGAGTNNLANAKLTLAATSPQWPAMAATAVNDSNTAVSLATAPGSVHGEYDYTFAKANNTLDLGANNSANLADGDAYQAQLTWALTSDTPALRGLS